MRDLIRAIVDGGVVVVEPAGNGGRDLASLGLPWLADPADPDAQRGAHGGAGGCRRPSPGTDRARTAAARTTAPAWTCRATAPGSSRAGYGQALGAAQPQDRAYTACFDGTSSASATVAGAVATLQGLARSPAPARRSRPPSSAPRWSRPGCPRRGTAAEWIGPRPQVAAAAGVIGPVEPPAGAATGPSRRRRAPRRARRRAPGAARRAAGRRGLRACASTGGRAPLTITLRGLARRAVVFVAGRRVRIATGGRIVLAVLTPRRFGLVVGAPRSRAGVSYSPVRFVVTVPPTGPARVVRR